MSPEAETTTARGGTESARRGGVAVQLVSRHTLTLALVLVAVAFALAKPDTFGTLDNLKSILSNQVTIVFLAFAATLPLIVGQFDLSVGAVFTVVQVLVTGLVVEHGWSPVAAIPLMLVAGGLIGLVNGVAVAKLGLNSFVTTLAVGSVMSGAALAYTNGTSVYGSAPRSFTSLARDAVWGVPLPFVYAVVVGLGLWLMLSRFPTGRRLYAIGANPRAAERTGIPTDRYVIGAFVASGLLAGVGGVLLGARLGAATSDSGSRLLIPAFAGAFLGTTAFSPGRFNIPGTFVAVYLVGVAVAGLQQFGVALWVEPVFEGLMLLAALGLAAWLGRLRGRLARLARLQELERRAAESLDRPSLSDPQTAP